jgi:hypothetical protein
MVAFIYILRNLLFANPFWHYIGESAAPKYGYRFKVLWQLVNLN